MYHKTDLEWAQIYAEEANWVSLAKKGDPLAFANLVERYQRAVYNLCYRMLGDAGEAEDAAQETFLRAYKALDAYDSSRKLSTWLLSIASHYCIDQLRKRRYTIFSLDGLPFFELTDPQPGPEHQAVQTERQRQVQQILNSLQPVDRAAVLMRYWYDFSYEEIASTLSLTTSAVKSRLHRARLSLAAAWQENESSQTVQTRNVYETETS